MRADCRTASAGDVSATVHPVATMTDASLVERLLEFQSYSHDGRHIGCPDVCREAAQALSLLEAENKMDKIVEAVKKAWRIEAARQGDAGEPHNVEKLQRVAVLATLKAIGEPSARDVLEGKP